jgi:hypothetical protein
MKVIALYFDEAELKELILNQRQIRDRTKRSLQGLVNAHSAVSSLGKLFGFPDSVLEKASNFAEGKAFLEKQLAVDEALLARLETEAKDYLGLVVSDKCECPACKRKEKGTVTNGPSEQTKQQTES